MLVTMLVILMASATAMFSIHATSAELRGAGLMRQRIQTGYVAEAALGSTMGMIDTIGPAAVVRAMQMSTAPNMSPNEPALAAGKHGYRVYLQDFSAATARPIEQHADSHPALGPQSAYEPDFAVDINDDYIFGGAVVGSRADGGGNLQYMFATLTARARTRIGTWSGATDRTNTYVGDARQINETVSESRAHIMVGPFGR